MSANKDPVFRFNLNFTKLLKYLESKFPTNGNVISLKNKISIAKDEDRLILIRKCGEYAERYHTHIFNRNIEFFMNKANIKELNELDRSHEFYEMAMDLFGLIVTAYRNLNKQQFDELYGYLYNLTAARMEWSGAPNLTKSTGTVQQ